MQYPNGSIFDAIESESFRLGSGSKALSIDGRQVHSGLPARVLPVAELRSVLLHPSTSHDARDAALAEVINRCDSSQEWRTCLIGLLLPALRPVAGALVRGSEVTPEEIDAEVLAGVIHGIEKLKPPYERIASKLKWAGYRSGLKCREGAQRAGKVETGSAEASAPSRPWGHPDLVLDEAVNLGVLDAGEAHLIGQTRLDDDSLADVAVELGITYGAAQRRRHRAEARLVTWLKDR